MTTKNKTVTLHDYIRTHTVHVSSTVPAVPASENTQLTDLTSPALPKKLVDVYFFKVGITGEPTVAEFKRLTCGFNSDGVNCDPLDGKERGYIELGGWIGSQEMALHYMALGAFLNLWRIMHPGRLLDVTVPMYRSLADRMAGSGLVTVTPIN